jgi:hypothetical protein
VDGFRRDLAASFAVQGEMDMRACAPAKPTDQNVLVQFGLRFRLLVVDQDWLEGQCARGVEAKHL